MDILTRPAGPAPFRDAPARRPFPDPRWAVPAVLALVTGAVLVVTNPWLLLTANTPAGGDMGAHVYAPAYLRDVLLPQGRIMGWSNGWFAGFPIFYFYFPLPSLVIVALDLVVPYGVAFKVVTVLGLMALPTATYFLVRWMGFDRWTATVAGGAGASFVLMESYSIYGANLPSTLAGEFSFSWSFALSVAYLGLVVRAARQDRGFTAAAGVVLAATALTHLVTTLAVVVASLPLLVRREGRPPVLGAWGLGFALAGFWSVPLLARLGLTADMAWVPLSGWGEILPREIWPVLLLGAMGLGWALWRRTEDVVPLLWLTLLPVVAYFLLPQGKLWNGRFLPYWYYGMHVFAGVGVGLGLLAVTRRLPGRWWVRPAGAGTGAVLFTAAALAGLAFVPAWARWNYTGYEGKEGWPEYRALMETVGALPPGRVQWEANKDLNHYGTPMALMLFPYWTEGTHHSMEGLFFESALTTPFHFLNAAEMSHRPSNPIPGLRYHTFDFDRGVRHLGAYGVRYYVSFTEEAAEAAHRHPELTEVAASPPFTVFELPAPALVEVAGHLPAVYEGRDFHQAALAWYDDLELLDRWMVAAGPDHWPRVDGPEEVGGVALTAGGEVSEVVLEDHRISFTTTAVGIPHLVKVSYFPNWRAEGAEGPYRAAPSLMVVVPTRGEVELQFGRTWAEEVGVILSVLGLVTLAGAALVRRRAP